MTGAKQKARATFLAAIMVLSVVAMSTAFVGSAAADVTSADRTIEETELAPGETTEVTITAEFSEEPNTLGLTDTFDPNVQESDYVSLDPEPGLNDVALSEPNQIDVAYTDAPGTTTLEIVYTVTMPDSENISAGETITFDGDVYFNQGEDEASISGPDTITIVEDEEPVDEPDHQITEVDPDFDISAEPGESLMIDATVENQGTQTGTQDAELVIDGDVVASESVDLEPGENQTVTFTPAAPETEGEYDWYVQTEDSQSDTWTLSVQEAAEVGFIQGDVRDAQNNPIENADVVVTDAATGEYFNTTTDDGGAFTVEVPGERSYNVVIDREGFESFSKTAVPVEPGETERIDVTLTRFITPDRITVSPSEATALADGDDSVSYTVTVEGHDVVEDEYVPVDGVPVEAMAASGDVDFDTTTQTTDADGMATFTATSDVVHSSTLTFTEQEQGNVAEATANFRAIEGEQIVRGDVEDRDGFGDIEGAIVYAAYPGENQTLEYAQNNQDFLIDETNADGEFRIDGINFDGTGEGGMINLYVLADGYNGINATEVVDGHTYGDVGEYYASDDTLSLNHPSQGVNNVTWHDGFALEQVELDLEYDVTVTVEGDEGYSDDVRMPTQTERDVMVEVGVRDAKSPDDSYTPVEDSSLVDSVDVSLDLEGDIGIGDLSHDSFDTADGVDVTFTSSRQVGDATINASVMDDDGEMSFDTADVEVYGVGEITGDVTDDDEPATNIRGAHVELFQRLDNGTTVSVDDTTTGSDGSYSFTNVETGYEYEVVATDVDDNEGYTVVDKTESGTTNADVVIVGGVPEEPDDDEAFFDVSDVEAADVTQGETLEISATIENTGDAEGTQDISYLLEGEDVVAGSSALDIVFTFDTTYSMSSQIDGAQAALMDFVDEVEASGADARFGLVEFKNDDDSVTLRQDLTDDSDAVQTEIDALSASGGGVFPEASYRAITMATDETDQRDDAQLVVVHITDAPAHFDGDGEGTTDLSRSDTANALNDANARFVLAGPDDDDDFDDYVGLYEESNIVDMAINDVDDSMFVPLGSSDFGDLLSDEIADAVTEAAGGQEVTLDAGENATVTFEVDTDDLAPGEYDVTVNSGDDSASSMATIEEGDGEDPGDEFDVSDYDTDGDGQIGFSEAGAAIADFNAGDIGFSEAGQVIAAYNTGEAV